MAIALRKKKNKRQLVQKPFDAILTFIIVILLTTGCSEEQNLSNKLTYEIKVGETFEYYVRSNSCCPPCWLNLNSMTSIQFVGDRPIKEPEDCDGCTSWYAYIFKGVKPGQDTIKYFEITPQDTCQLSTIDSLLHKPSFSTVKVRP